MLTSPQVGPSAKKTAKSVPKPSTATPFPIAITHLPIASTHLPIATHTTITPTSTPEPHKSHQTHHIRAHQPHHTTVSPLHLALYRTHTSHHIQPHTFLCYTRTTHKSPNPSHQNSPAPPHYCFPSTFGTLQKHTQPSNPATQLFISRKKSLKIHNVFLGFGSTRPFIRKPTAPRLIQKRAGQP